MKKIHNYEAVSRLYSILNYELATTTLLFLSFMYGLLLFLALATAILFTPFLLYVLFIEKRFGWIISFIIIVIGPFIITIPFGIVETYSIIIIFLSLAIFYFYCFIIRFTIKDWLKEYRWELQLERQKREKEFIGKTLKFLI